MPSVCTKLGDGTANLSIMGNESVAQLSQSLVLWWRNYSGKNTLSAYETLRRASALVMPVTSPRTVLIPDPPHSRLDPITSSGDSP